MPARVRGFELVVRIHFFTRLQTGKHAFSSQLFEFAAVEIDAVLRVDPVSMLFQEPVDAIEISAFLIGGQSQDQVAVRLVAFAFQAKKTHHQDRVALLHVAGPASVEVAILLDKLEWVGGPVFAPRFHDVQVPDEKHRRAPPHAVQTDNQVFLAGVWSRNDYVRLWKTRSAKTLRHGLRSSSHIADRVRGVDFNQLLKNGARLAIDLHAVLAMPQRSHKQCAHQRCHARPTSHPHLLIPVSD